MLTPLSFTGRSWNVFWCCWCFWSPVQASSMSSTVKRTRVKIGGERPLSPRCPAWRPNKSWDPSFHRMWYLTVRSIVRRIQVRCEITSPASSCRAVGWNICTPTPTCSSAGYHPNISFLLVSFSLCIIEAMGLRGGSVPRKKRAALFMYSWGTLSVLPPHLNADLLVWRGCASLSKNDESSIARFANKKCVKRGCSRVNVAHQQPAVDQSRWRICRTCYLSSL